MTELTFLVAPEYAPQDTPVPLTRVRVEERPQLVEEKVSVRALPITTATHVSVAADQWDWRQLRDYVVGRIEAITGPFPRNDAKEFGIFNSFLTRWGQDAAPIARYAFETMNGFWKGAPVSISRFCKGSDPYFAVPIVEHLKR